MCSEQVNEVIDGVLLTAVTAYVLPTNNGYGGLEAGVPGYLQQWLNSPQGSVQRPLIEWGLRFIQTEYQARHQTGFADGRSDHCLALLSDLAKLEHRHYQVFWRTLIHACLQGFVAHPRHGGNCDVGAWRLLGYPGSADQNLSLHQLIQRSS